MEEAHRKQMFMNSSEESALKISEGESRTEGNNEDHSSIRLEPTRQALS